MEDEEFLVYVYDKMRYLDRKIKDIRVVLNKMEKAIADFFNYLLEKGIDLDELEVKRAKRYG
jgi:hypothetical protein